MTGHTIRVSPGERSRVLRKRAGRSIAQEAAFRQVSVWRVVRWEGDAVVPPHVAPAFGFMELTTPELLRIVLDRSGVTARDVARRMGVTPAAVSAMENGRLGHTKLWATIEEMTSGGVNRALRGVGPIPAVVPPERPVGLDSDPGGRPDGDEDVPAGSGA